MPGKALSISALSLMLWTIFGGVCCQAAGSYGPKAQNSVYKHHHLTRETVLAALKADRDAAINRTLSQGADINFDGDRLCLAIWGISGATERQLKICTVALARAIMRHFPGVFEEFDCSFFDPLAPGHWRRAELKLSGLKAGQTQDWAAVQLISERDASINERYQGLSYRQILDQDRVAGGAFQSERKELSDELTTLKANGYDVNQATRQFFALEDLVRTRQYSQLTAAFARTRQCIAEAVAEAQGISVASSRTKNWQR